MNFHLKSERYERRKFALLPGVTFVFLLIIVIQIFIPSFFPAVFIRIVGPIWSVEKSDDRDQKIAELQAKIDAFALIEKEHQTLLQELGQHTSSDLLLGKVLSLPPSTVFDTVIINIGSSEGVIKDKKVFAGENILIGTVDQVFSHTAKVKLYSSPGTEYQVLLGISTTSLLTAFGRGGGVYEVSVPRELEVHVGDLVTLPGLSNSIYAKVEQVISDPARAFATVLFKSPIPLQSITRLYVER